MSKILILYFSQGGTTAQVAESIAAGLRSSGNTVDLCNINNGHPEPLEGYDLLGFGTPTYYFRPSFNVTDYINTLPKLNGIPAFAFVLYGTYCGDAGNLLRRALSLKGAQEAGYFSCRGADFYHGYLKEGYLFSPDSPTVAELTQAVQFGHRVARVLAGQEYIPPKPDLSPGIIYRIERFFSNQWLASVVLSRLFSLNKKKCTACHLCIKQCPTGNITANKDGHPVWSRSCLLCLSCEMNCPQEAITSPSNWPIFRLFIKYNVSHAAQDSSLTYVRVKHIRGKTTRMTPSK